MLNLAELHV